MKEVFETGVYIGVTMFFWHYLIYLRNCLYSEWFMIIMFFKTFQKQGFFSVCSSQLKIVTKRPELKVIFLIPAKPWRFSSAVVEEGTLWSPPYASSHQRKGKTTSGEPPHQVRCPTINPPPRPAHFNPQKVSPPAGSQGETAPVFTALFKWWTEWIHHLLQIMLLRLIQGSVKYLKRMLLEIHRNPISF